MVNERIQYNRCPLCASEKLFDLRLGDCSKHPLYDQSLSPLILWRRCDLCGHVFTEGYYSDEALKIIFGKSNNHQKVGGAIEQNRLVSSRIVEKVLPYASDGYWLDIGFGNGSLLFTAQEYGFKPIGIDLRAANVAALESLGIEAYCQDLTDLNLSERVSVMSFADVLEHTPYPGKVLKEANNLLDTNGVLFISLPNTENVVWKIMNDQNKNPYWGEMEHYHNFSRTRLYSLLEDFGFNPVRYGVSERYRVCMEVISVKKMPV